MSISDYNVTDEFRLRGLSDLLACRILFGGSGFLFAVVTLLECSV